MKKAIAVVSTIALVAALFIGVNVTQSAKADSEVALQPWSFFEGGETGRSVDPDGWPERFYNSVTTTAGESKGSDFWYVGPHKQYQDGPEVTWDSTQAADGFTADIKTTGWDGEWSGGTCIADNPWLMTAYMNAPVLQGHRYTLSFKAKWTNRKDAPEKNIRVAATDEFTNSMFEEGAETEFKVQSGNTYNYSANLVLYANCSTMKVTLAYGAFLYSTQQGLTTEVQAASGTLQVSDFKIIDKGYDPTIPTDPPKPTTTPRPTAAPTTEAPTGATTAAPQTTKAPETTKAPTPAPKKIAKVTGVKVKSVKKKTIKVTWKKAKNAKKYQIKANNKTYNASKTSRKIKNKKFKKGKKVKVKVRGIDGSKKGAWSKTVKKKITK